MTIFLPEDRTVYMDRLKAAWCFSAGNIADENCHWLRIRLVFELLGNVPLEPIHSSWSQDFSGVIKKRRIGQPQIRHHSQLRGLEGKMSHLDEAVDENGEEIERVWSVLAPE